MLDRLKVVQTKSIQDQLQAIFNCQILKSNNMDLQDIWMDGYKTGMNYVISAQDLNPKKPKKASQPDNKTQSTEHEDYWLDGFFCWLLSRKNTFL